MPVLHIQYSGQGADPSGNPVAIPPGIALIQRGPVVQVSISVAESIAQQLVQQGQTLPPPITGLALIDTGASSTCVDESAAQQLGLPVIDIISMASASHAATQAHVYPMQIEVVGLPIRINANRAIGAALAAQGLLVLIGRDVLQNCTLHYNGVSGELTLAI